MDIKTKLEIIHLTKMLKALRSNEYKKASLKVAAVSFNSETGEFINVKINDFKKFSKSNVKEKCAKYHAEQLLFENYKNKVKINILVNIPPCEFCINRLNKEFVKGNLDKVYYIDNFQLNKKINDFKIKFPGEDIKFKLLKFNPQSNVQAKKLTEEIRLFYEEYYFSNFILYWIRKNILNKKFKLERIQISKKEVENSKALLKICEKKINKRILYDYKGKKIIRPYLFSEVYELASKKQLKISLDRQKKLERNNKNDNFLKIRELEKFVLKNI